MTKDLCVMNDCPNEKAPREDLCEEHLRRLQGEGPSGTISKPVRDANAVAGESPASTSSKPIAPAIPQAHRDHDAAWSVYWRDLSKWQERELMRLHNQLLEHAEVCGESAYPISDRVAVETDGASPLSKRCHVACKDNVSPWEYPHLVICFKSIADLHAAARYLSSSPELPAGAQEVRKLYNANVDDLNCEICAGIGHEFRPIDSSGQLACIYCHQRQVNGD